MLLKSAHDEPIVPTWEAADSQAFRAAIGSFLTGITVVTAIDDYGNVMGMAANSLTSVTMDPPTLLICLNQGAATRHAVNSSGKFVLNILSADQSHVVQSFAKRHVDGDKLEGIEHELIDGYGVAIHGAMASFVCTMSETVLHGTHQVVFGLVERVLYQDAIPMAYFRGKFDALPRLADDTLRALTTTR